MLRVGLAMADGSVSEERLEAEFDVVHLHDAVDGAFAQFVGQREDIHRYGRWRTESPTTDQTRDLDRMEEQNRQLRGQICWA